MLIRLYRMKNVINKIVTVLSGISSKSNQIQKVLQTGLITNQQYQVINTLCDQISARYFIVKDPLSDITYLFKCQIGDTKYEGDQLDIQEDVIVWDKPVPNDGTQYTITIIDDYYGSIDYKWAYGIQQNKNIYLDLNGHVLAYLPIYNKGQLTIKDSYGEEYIVIKDGYYIINEGILYLDSGILDSIRNIDNSGILILNGGCIKNSNLICLSGSTFIINGGSIESCQLTIQNIKEFNMNDVSFNNSKLIFNTGSQINYNGGYIKNSELIIDSNIKIFMYQNQSQDFRNFESCVFKVKQTGNLIIEYNGGRLSNCQCILQLYGNRKYDYRQIVVKSYMDEEQFQQMYSKGWCNIEVHCYQGATLENYNGNIQYHYSNLRKIYFKQCDRGKTQLFSDSINRNILFYMNFNGIYDNQFNELEYYEITNGQDLIYVMQWIGDDICYIYNLNIYVNETLYKTYEVRQTTGETRVQIDLPQIKENQNYYIELIETGTYDAR